MYSQIVFVAICYVSVSNYRESFWSFHINIKLLDHGMIVLGVHIYCSGWFLKSYLRHCFATRDDPAPPRSVRGASEAKRDYISYAHSARRFLVWSGLWWREERGRGQTIQWMSFDLPGQKKMLRQHRANLYYSLLPSSAWVLTCLFLPNPPSWLKINVLE